MSRGLNFILPPSALILRRWGETTGDRHPGDSTRAVAPVVPPLHYRTISYSLNVLSAIDVGRREANGQGQGREAEVAICGARPCVLFHDILVLRPSP